MAAKFILDGYTFDWNPDTYTPPEGQKVVVSERLIDGSIAVFQWEATDIGLEVVLGWDLCSEAQFQTMRNSCLKTSVLSFIPGDGRTYGVTSLMCTGELVDVALYDLEYRANVELSLLIRSVT